MRLKEIRPRDHYNKLVCAVATLYNILSGWFEFYQTFYDFFLLYTVVNYNYQFLIDFEHRNAQVTNTMVTCVAFA